jgi:hypothetical protein
VPDAALPGEDELGRLAEVLRRHLAEGRLTLPELDDRLERLYAATTSAQARAALDGLPALPSPAPPRRRVWGRRHAEAGRPEPHWVSTDERFRDPSSGRLMRVWLDPGDGSRHYLAEG